MLLAGGLTLAGATAAQAGTLVATSNGYRFQAAPGEANLLHIGSEAPATLTFSDVNPITYNSASTGCTGTDPVRCPLRPDTVQVFLDDNNDTEFSDANENLAAADQIHIHAHGGTGDDQLGGDTLADDLFGDEGDHDIVRGSSEPGGGIDGADVLSGGPGANDLADYGSRSAVPGVRVTIDSKADDGAPGEGDLVGSSIEQVNGTPGPDIIVGSSADNVLNGGDGNDIINGGGGADLMFGDPGWDVVSYHGRVGAVNVSLNGVADDGSPGEGDNAAGGFEAISGGLGNDTLTGDDGRNALYGGTGNDTLNGLGANDRLVGERGADTFDGGLGDDIYDARTHDDASVDTFVCGPGSDTILASPEDTNCP